MRNLTDAEMLEIAVEDYDRVAGRIVLVDRVGIVGPHGAATELQLDKPASVRVRLCGEDARTAGIGGHFRDKAFAPLYAVDLAAPHEELAAEKTNYVIHGRPISADGTFGTAPAWFAA